MLADPIQSSRHRRPWEVKPPNPCESRT
jgi:hypothetical protein